MTIDFKGRVTVVTGGASGIGLATVRGLIDCGASVFLMDLDQQLQSLPPDLRTQVQLLPVDVSDEHSVLTAFAAVRRVTPRLDGLVCSAGIRMRSTPLADLGWSEWERLLAVNLKGVVLCCKEAARIMVPQGSGSIVNVASLAARAPRPGQTAYGASKAAVVQVTRVLALELAESGVRVNSVCPGTTATPMIERAKIEDSADVVATRIQGDTRVFRPGIPLRRIADAEDQAGPILFLLSDIARHITGQSIFVDGGESIV